MRINTFKTTLLAAAMAAVMASCGTPRDIAYVNDAPRDTAIAVRGEFSKGIQPNDLLNIYVESSSPEVTLQFNQETNKIAYADGQAQLAAGGGPHAAQRPPDIRRAAKLPERATARRRLAGDCEAVLLRMEMEDDALPRLDVLAGVAAPFLQLGGEGLALGVVPCDKAGARAQGHDPGIVESLVPLVLGVL